MEFSSLLLHNQGQKMPKAGKKNHIFGDFFSEATKKTRKRGRNSVQKERNIIPTQYNAHSLKMCQKRLHFYSIAIENCVYCRTKIISGFKKRKKKKFSFVVKLRLLSTMSRSYLGLQGSFLALSNESSPPYIRKALRWHDWHGIDITRD